MSAGEPVSDARLALRLLSLAPRKFGGIVLRGGGPLRDLLLEEFRASLPDGIPWRRMPTGIDDSRLSGGIDIAASLAAGEARYHSGLLDEAAGGFVVVPMAERMPPALAGRLAQAMDVAAQDFALILLDDGIDSEERAPDLLVERVAFSVDLTGLRTSLSDTASSRPANPLAEAEPVDSEGLEALALTAEQLAIVSLRPLLFASHAAQIVAAIAGHDKPDATDLSVAARLVLAPRATRLPPSEESAPEMQPDDPSPDPGDPHSEQPDTPPDEIVLEAALSAIPPDLLAQLAAGGIKRRAQGGAGGKRTRSKLRGRPLGAVPGIPRGGARLALVDTLRAAVPWQSVRRRGNPESSGRPIIVHRDDLRVRRFEDRSSAVTIFCVDASGSAAMARLAEAKGAVERLLAQAYVKRTEVALIAFRGKEAEVLLPPTRSLTRARRALAELPGGGGTPLASGITLARKLAEAVAARGQTPFLAFLTDGSANIAADGSAGRAAAKEDALAAARALGASGHASLVIDISPLPRPEAKLVADALRARYLPLPLADSASLVRAVEFAQTESDAA